MRLYGYGFNIIMFITMYSEAYHTFNLESETKPQWPSIFTLLKHPQTVIMDVDSDSSVTMKDSFIKSIHRDQSVLIISGKEMPEKITGEKLMTVIMKNSNLVFSTKYINSSMLDDPILKYMLRSQWSILLIAVTTQDSLYKCDQGEFIKEANNNIEVYMNELWHKYRMIYVILALPYVCPNEYVVYDGTKPSSGAVYNRTIKLVNTTRLLAETMPKKLGRILTRNYPLKGNIFERFPTAITDCSGTEIYMKTSNMLSGGFCGMDGLVMADVIRQFEFNLSLPRLGPGCNKFGYQQENGVITGSLGHVVRGDVDVSFNSRFLVAYVEGLWKYNFLNPLSHDSLCAVMKHPDEQPLWQYPYNAYTLPQWLIILTSFTTVGVFMWITARIKNKMYGRKTSSLSLYIRNSINAGLFGFFLTRKNDLLILRGVCLYVSIMLLATYQSYINNLFTTRWYIPMNTLADLVYSGTVLQTSPSINTLLEIPVNDAQGALKSRTIVLDKADSYNYVLSHPNTATLERQTDAIQLALMKYTDEHGKPMLYVVNECLRNFYLNYITNTDFPFVPQLDVFLMRLTESGLPGMYYTWTSRSLGLDVTLPNMASEPRPAEKITLAALIVAFSVLFSGYLLSAIVLVIEIWRVRRTRLYPYLP